MLSPRDTLAAMPDALMLRAGLNVRHPHPMAEQLAAEARLADLAEVAGHLRAEKEGRPLRDTRAALGAGLSSHDFGAGFAKGMLQLLRVRYDAMADHRPLCADLPVRDFHEQEFPRADIDVTLPRVLEDGEIQSASVMVGAGVTARLHTFGRKLIAARKVIVNDQFELLQQTFSNLGTSAGRLENKMVFDALEANPTLEDEELLFHVDHGNIEASALDADPLGAAIGKIRNQKMPNGALSNYAARFLVVAPELELKARKLVHESGAGLDVISSAHIAAGRWYVMADPEVAPVVGRLFLRGSDGRPLLLDPAPAKIEIDGALFKFRADLGVVVVGRVGIVRGGA